MINKYTWPLGFGLMRLPTDSEGKIDEIAAGQMVDYAMAQGINYFDTAYNYHGGESELFIGKALKKYPRDAYFLTSKMPVFKLESKEDTDKVFHEQLNKCQTEYFDNYLVHSLNRDSWNKAVEFGVVEYLLEKKAEGKIKNLGFSFHDSYEFLEPIITYASWDFVQLQLNYYDMAVGDAKHLLAIANAHKLPIIIMEPIRGGFLARCVPNALQAIRGAYPGKNPAPALALSYAFDLDGVVLTLSGMSDLDQVKENIQTAKSPIKMDEKSQKVIKKVLEEIHAFTTVPCTKCSYCMPCPVGLNIPEIFQIYNDHELFKNAFQTKNRIAKLDHQPEECIACGKCMNACPQRLEIPDLMQQIANKFSNL